MLQIRPIGCFHCSCHYHPFTLQPPVFPPILSHPDNPPLIRYSRCHRRHCSARTLDVYDSTLTTFPHHRPSILHHPIPLSLPLPPLQPRPVLSPPSPALDIRPPIFANPNSPSSQFMIVTLPTIQKGPRSSPGNLLPPGASHLLLSLRVILTELRGG
jgi:hypothetical protein